MTENKPPDGLADLTLCLFLVRTIRHHTAPLGNLPNGGEGRRLA